MFSGTVRKIKCIAARCAAPNVKPCSHWVANSTVISVELPSIVQRSRPAIAAIHINLIGVRRAKTDAENAKRIISATTPSAHKTPIRASDIPLSASELYQHTVLRGLIVRLTDKIKLKTAFVISVNAGKRCQKLLGVRADRPGDAAGDEGGNHSGHNHQRITASPLLSTTQPPTYAARMNVIDPQSAHGHN